jgi:hypothetical protein
MAVIETGTSPAPELRHGATMPASQASANDKKPSHPNNGGYFAVFGWQEKNASSSP